MEEDRVLNVTFIREFRSFTSVHSKKTKEDYILNVNKIIKDKLIYLNSNISVSLIKNAMVFIEEEYFPILFKFNFIEPKEFDKKNLDLIDNLNVIKLY